MTMTPDKIEALGISLRQTMRKSVNALEALKEQCRHEEKNITHSEVMAICACGEILWRKETWPPLKIQFTESELSNPGPLRQRFEHEYQVARQKLAKLQKICVHPKIVHSNRGDPFEQECGICEKDYFEILQERKRSITATS